MSGCWHVPVACCSTICCHACTCKMRADCQLPEQRLGISWQASGHGLLSFHRQPASLSPLHTYISTPTLSRSARTRCGGLLRPASAKCLRRSSCASRRMLEPCERRASWQLLQGRPRLLSCNAAGALQQCYCGCSCSGAGCRIIPTYGLLPAMGCLATVMPTNGNNRTAG